MTTNERRIINENGLTSDLGTYVIFGEAKIKDLSSQLQTQAAKRFRMPQVGATSQRHQQPQ